MATTRTAKTHWEGSLWRAPARSPSSRPASARTTSRGPPAPRSPTARPAPRSSSPPRTRVLLDGAVERARQGAARRRRRSTRTADVTFQPGEGITGIHLTVVGTVEGINAEDFAAAAEDAKKNCPVSQALTGTTITLDASLA